MIDHLGFAVSDAAASARFYDALLGAIGIRRMLSIPPDQTASGGRAVGFGDGRTPFFWIGDGEKVGEGTHVAFAVDSRDAVRAFHAAGIAAGGRDNGEPGLRPHYHPHYYAAFILDPDGHNVEAVCHSPG